MICRVVVRSLQKFFQPTFVYLSRITESQQCTQLFVWMTAPMTLSIFLKNCFCSNDPQASKLFKKKKSPTGDLLLLPRGVNPIYHIHYIIQIYMGARCTFLAPPPPPWYGPPHHIHIHTYIHIFIIHIHNIHIHIHLHTYTYTHTFTYIYIIYIIHIHIHNIRIHIHIHIHTHTYTYTYNHIHII